MTVIDLSPANADLYRGCMVQKSRGKKFLITPPNEAVAIIGENLKRALSQHHNVGESALTFTGAMTPWIYLMAGSLAATLGFTEVHYTDGQTEFAIPRGGS